MQRWEADVCNQVANNETKVCLYRLHYLTHPAMSRLLSLLVHPISPYGTDKMPECVSIVQHAQHIMDAFKDFK